jgi:hypothetical protein
MYMCMYVDIYICSYTHSMYFYVGVHVGWIDGSHWKAQDRKETAAISIIFHLILFLRLGMHTSCMWS